jgi:uncharacterized protein YdaU (DUF1376 family)
MAKDPAFLFYTGDFSTGTQFFTDEQVGIYIRLLMAQHQHGRLNEKHMNIICKSYDKDIYLKFERDNDGLYFNERLETEILKRKNFCESRGKNRSSKNIISKSYENHMENENENKDIIITNNKNDEIFEILNSSESWIESTAMQSNQKFKPDQIRTFLKKYNDMINVQFEIKQNRTEYCTHFINWLNKQPKENNYDTTQARNDGVKR